MSTLSICLLGACASDTAMTPTTVTPTTVTPSTVTSTTSAPTSTTTPSQSVLFDFSDPTSVTGWFNQNDTIMGGVSDSASVWVAGHLVFSGNLSLDNNGGFTSTFGPINEQLPALMSVAKAIAVTARGDGQTYLMQIRSNDNTLYIQRFTTIADSEQSYILQIGFYLMDKQVGPFEIASSSISADSL